MDEPIKIDDRKQVDFIISDVTFNVSIRHGVLKINTDGHIIVRPEAANQITISVEPYGKTPA